MWITKVLMLLVVSFLLDTGYVVFTDGAYNNASVPEYCGGCDVFGEDGVLILISYNTTVSASYVTKLVTVNSNGTTTRLINNTVASADFTSSIASLSSEISSLYPSMGFPGGQVYTVDVVNGSYLTAAGVQLNYADYGIRTVINGTTTCQYTSTDCDYSTQSQCEAYSVTTTGDIFNTEVGDSFVVPGSFYTTCGIYLPPNCSVTLGGEPTAQIPVEYLTSTITINNVPDNSGRTTSVISSSTTGQTQLALPLPTPVPITPLSTTGLAPLSPPPDTDPSSSQNTIPSNELNPPSTTTNQLQSQPSPTPTTVDVGNMPFIVSGSQVTVDSQPLSPGSAITANGIPISLAPSAAALVIGTIIYDLAPGHLPSASVAAPVITLGASLLTLDPLALSASAAAPGVAYLVGSQTLAPGSAITVDGTAISLMPSGTALVVGSSTLPLPAASQNPASSSIVFGPALALGSSFFAENSASALVLDGYTLTPGYAMTVGGTVVSLEPGGSVAIVGGVTETLGSVTAIATGANPDPGGVIWSTFGGGGGAGGTATGSAGGSGNGTSVIGLGGAERRELDEMWKLVAAVGMGIGFLL